MTGRDLLPLAARPAKGTTEAKWRTAVSRADDAAFQVARQWMEDLNFRLPRADRAHDYRYQRLQNGGDPQVQRAGAELNSLQGLRNQADYDFRYPFLRQVSSQQVGIVQQIIQVLDQATQETTRTQITDAMKTYERDVLIDVTWHP